MGDVIGGVPVYRPDGATLRGFMSSDARVRVIRGPIRSGTSSMCLQELFRRACSQLPGPGGVRRTRWFIVRNTYSELEQSTLVTWQNWFPEDVYGSVLRSRPMVHRVRVGDVDAEFVFLALDSAEDVKKLRSTEWTGGFINELEYIKREIFETAESRCGYFPAKKDGGPTWSGLVADLNAPSMDHWLPMMTGEAPLPEDMPEGERMGYRWPSAWAYFVQPPALIEEFGPDGRSVVGYRLNPKAENLKWIPPASDGRHRYLTLIDGKTKQWIDANLMNRLSAPVMGTPVWPMFRPETHVARVPLQVVAGREVFVGLDFGRKPAAVFAQLVNDRWSVQGELLGTDVGASTFAPMVKRYLEQNYPRVEWQLFGDPKGQDRTQSDERTAYDIFRANGLHVRPAPVPDNAIKTRVEVIEKLLNEMRDGQPRFLVSQACRVLVAGMGGGYHYRKEADQNGEFKPEKKKGRYSDVCDALQYMVLGAGEGDALVGRRREPGRVVRMAPRRGLGRRGVGA